MAEEKPKVKVKDKVKVLKKYIVFLPLLLFLPLYVFHPSESLILILSIAMAFHFLCFMAPVFAIKHMIEKLDLSQKITDVISWFSVVFMWGFCVLEWIRFFIFEDYGIEFPAGIFLIPFISLVKVGIGIIFLTILYKIYIFFVRIDKSK